MHTQNQYALLCITVGDSPLLKILQGTAAFQMFSSLFWVSDGCGFVQKMTSASQWPSSLSKYWDRTKLPLMLSCPQISFLSPGSPPLQPLPVEESSL